MHALTPLVLAGYAPGSEEDPMAEEAKPATDEELPEHLRRHRERAIAHLTKHWPEPRTCPICKSNSWTVSDDFVQLFAFPAGGGIPTFPPKNMYPALQVLCMVCGHTLLFNALVAGLLVLPGEVKHGQ
jgi:hypothetical protein